MARAKNTARAEARRKARIESRAELDAAQQDDLTTADGATGAAGTPATPPARRPLLSLPNFRQDLRDLPRILTSRRAMVVAPLMLIVGFVLQLANSRGALPADYGLPFPLAENGWVSFATVGDFYVQMFFLPPALLTFFLAGYIAPRASYLIGALNGLLSGALWSILFVTSPLPTDSPLGGQTDTMALVGYVFILNVAYGTFAAAFAAWYRDFLRRMRDQGVARRAEREAQERAKRREQRQADRRGGAKSR